MSSAVDRDLQPGATAPVRSRRPVLIFAGVLIVIVLTSYVIRIATDAPFLVTGTDPEPEDFEARYVAHPWLAYAHMTPGADFHDSFATAFWMGLSLHVLAGEWWIRTTADKTG